jgi:hypothetical protein
MWIEKDQSAVPGAVGLDASACEILDVKPGDLIEVRSLSPTQ